MTANQTPAASPPGNGCGARHLKLAGMIVGIVLCVCAGAVGWTARDLSAQDVRLRKVEQDSAANAARFEAIREQLADIKAQLKAGRAMGVSSK